MIFISTSCVRAQKINDAIAILAEEGFKKIELSGGTNYYEGILTDLKNLKEKYGLTYLIHNYFPPPMKHFVLNLASANKQIYEATINHYKDAISLAEKLGVIKYGIHAGFLIDPNKDELGKGISKQSLTDREKALDIFCKGYNEIRYHSSSVEVYIENNVISLQNYQTYKINPFLLTDFVSYTEINNLIDFKLLLDLAHLKVSCKTLGLDFKNELHKLLNLSDYIHISDNSGFADSNSGISETSDILSLLKEYDLRDKIITLEIYEELTSIEGSYKLINELIK